MPKTGVNCLPSSSSQLFCREKFAGALISKSGKAIRPYSVYLQEYFCGRDLHQLSAQGYGGRIGPFVRRCDGTLWCSPRPHGCGCDSAVTRLQESGSKPEGGCNNAGCCRTGGGCARSGEPRACVLHWAYRGTGGEAGGQPLLLAG
jgi:hypothetical protein